MTVQSLRRDAHTLHNFAPTAVKYHNRSSPYLSGYPHSSPRPNTNLMKRPGRPSALKPVVSILLRSREQRRNNRGVDRGQGFKMSFGADDTSAWRSSFYSRELGGSMILVLDVKAPTPPGGIKGSINRLLLQTSKGPTVFPSAVGRTSAANLSNKSDAPKTPAAMKSSTSGNASFI
jgi:hypothetical protein